MSLPETAVSVTGRYENPATDSYECWAVNHATGEKWFLGGCDRRAPAETVRRWESRVWRGMFADLWRIRL